MRMRAYARARGQSSSEPPAPHRWQLLLRLTGHRRSVTGATEAQADLSPGLRSNPELCPSGPHAVKGVERRRGAVSAPGTWHLRGGAGPAVCQPRAPHLPAHMSKQRPRAGAASVDGCVCCFHCIGAGIRVHGLWRSN